MQTGPSLDHNSVMHDGIEPQQERNQDLLVIQDRHKFGSN